MKINAHRYGLEGRWMRLTVVQGRTGSKGTGRLNKEQQNIITQRWHYDQRTKEVDSFCLKKLRYTD